jgi:hypothetical protein
MTSSRTGCAQLDAYCRRPADMLAAVEETRWSVAAESVARQFAKLVGIGVTA